jgi:uncharacterized protein YbgA (DUF1722 family)
LEQLKKSSSNELEKDFKELVDQYSSLIDTTLEKELRKSLITNTALLQGIGFFNHKIPATSKQSEETKTFNIENA